jgi:hypothetical protein
MDKKIIIGEEKTYNLKDVRGELEDLLYQKVIDEITPIINNLI